MDHLGTRLTVRQLLDWRFFEVCGEAKDGREAIEKVIELKPDIVLLDISMPGMNGITACHEIRRISPATKIVFLTLYDGPGFQAGTRPWAHGFVPKASADIDLIPTLNRLVGIQANDGSTSRRPATQ